METTGRLLLVRHARTDGNARGEPMGRRRDVPLDDVGRAQVVGLTAALDRALPPGTRVTVHSSPLVRARETIAPFAAARGIPVSLDPALMEMDFGTRAGTVESGRKLRVKKDHLYEPLPGGESLWQVWRRCEGFLAGVRPVLLSGGSVVVVTHYRVAQLLAGLASGRDFEAAVKDSTFKPAVASVLDMPFSGCTEARYFAVRG
jgi:2,3-bisphosphoglycerate-dependent phosphoglycerate mutase